MQLSLLVFGHHGLVLIMKVGRVDPANQLIEYILTTVQGPKHFSASATFFARFPPPPRDNPPTQGFESLTNRRKSKNLFVFKVTC
jgi:hypothetical protein